MNDSFLMFLKDGKHWRLYENPKELLIISSLINMQESLLKLDKFINEGKHIAGFMCYEAAAGLDSALLSKDLKEFPYAVFGIFDKHKSIKQLPPAKSYKTGSWKPSQTRPTYNSNITNIKKQIANGETYQVNYTMRLKATFKGDALSFFKNLTDIQQSDYAAYVQFKDYSICSTSPELFFKLSQDKIISRPMKGTADRGLSFLDDIRQRDKLRSSAKERAENLMIVDMIRNDMGKICESGSIKVLDMFKTERFPTVWQMTSDVYGKTNASFSSIINALFPCASITGAPKAKTMQIINELEQTPRKIYTGSIGYFDPDRKAVFNVAIRTALIDRNANTAEYGVGGGIVWDSIAANEFEECKVKAKVLTRQKINFQLLETMYVSKSEGFFLLDYHIKRLRQSAEYFNYRFNEKRITDKLDQILIGLASDLKIRLLLAENGQIEIEKSPFISAKEKTKNISFADKALHSSNVFLYHKTTHRDIYKQGYDQIKRDGLDDVIFCNERGEITESTVCNIVVKQQDSFYTPPVTCGLLNGTFRQSLIDQKLISEEVLLKRNISQFDHIYLINSVQQWTRAVLV